MSKTTQLNVPVGKKLRKQLCVIAAGIKPKEKLHIMNTKVVLKYDN